MFTKGQTVKCVNNFNTGLHVDGLYIVQGVSGGQVLITDVGVGGWYDDSRFRSLTPTMNMSALATSAEQVAVKGVGTRWVSVREASSFRHGEQLMWSTSNATNLLEGHKWERGGLERIYPLHDLPTDKDGVVIDALFLIEKGYMFTSWGGRFGWSSRRNESANECPTALDAVKAAAEHYLSTITKGTK